VGVLEARWQEDPPHLPARAEARTWRTDALRALARGGLRAPKPTTVGEAWDTWYAGARSSAVTNRSGSKDSSTTSWHKARAHRPFNGEKLTERADEAWKSAGLNRITLHECRHTFASLMIAAGVNAKALSTFMGHANISITLDRYGHLMPGSEAEAAELLDAYLAAQRERSERNQQRRAA